MTDLQQHGVVARATTERAPAQHRTRALLSICCVATLLAAISAGLFASWTGRGDQTAAGATAAGTSAPGVAPDAGAAAPGTTAYPVPAQAVFVSPTGADGASGSVSDPLPSAWAGINRAADGATVVLRAGVYHETVVIPDGKRLTLQAFPNETVWFDGSTVVGSWRPAGKDWVTDWAVGLDASPTYTQGAADDPRPGWTFVSPAYPMAAHPDQVWLDDVAQRQVATRAELTTDTFYLDTVAGRLYLGSDPTGRVTRASDLRQAIVMQSAGSVIRGFGVRRYADSVYQQGAVTLLGGRMTVENVSILQSATTGLGLLAQNPLVRRVTVSGSGMVGIGGFQADNAVLDRVVSVGNNTEHFNPTPVAGGMKITRSRGVVIADSSFSRNLGPGVWVDESCHDVTVVRSDIRDNANHGLVVEISSRILIAGNRVTGNGNDGILIANTEQVGIWNNTIAANERNLNLTQDDRDARDTGVPGHDLRQPFPDPTMTWLLRSIEVHNNVIALPNDKGDALIAVQDYSKQRRAGDLQINIDGNAYVRASRTTPVWAVVWSRAGNDPSVFRSIDEFRTQTGQEAYHYNSESADVLDARFRLVPSVLALAGSIARPLTSDIAEAVGKPAGTKRFGDWG